MDAMGRPLTQNDIKEFFETDSTIGQKKIDFSEFLSIMTSVQWCPKNKLITNN